MDEIGRITAVMSAGAMSASVQGTGSMAGVLDIPSRLDPDYGGAYEVTPSEEAQTLCTAGRTLSEDILIQPIPSNYGRITWNGSFLTVS